MRLSDSELRLARAFLALVRLLEALWGWLREQHFGTFKVGPARINTDYIPDSWGLGINVTAYPVWDRWRFGLDLMVGPFAVDVQVLI